MPHRVAQTLCFVFFLLSAITLKAVDGSYTIREGETLFAVARKAQVPVDVLRAYNGITDADKLKVGTVIRIPTLYTVKKGDTLYGIARAFSLPIGKLQELNLLAQEARIRAGDRIYIPGLDGVTNAAQAAALPPRATRSIMWPHPGRREPVKGKISGLVFFGSRGDVVHAATAGEVKWVAPYWGLGKIVLIRAADGSIFLYAGNEEILVNVGDRVSPGAEIARLGESPQGGGAKLYFSIQDAKSQTIDPEKYFSAKSQT